MFGGSKSKRTTTISNDNRAINGAENAVNGDGNVFNVLDGGAIDLAGELAQTYAKSQGNLFEKTSELSSHALETVGDLSKRQTESMSHLFDSFGDRTEKALLTSMDSIRDNNARVYEVVTGVTSSSSDRGLKSVQVMALAMIAGVVTLGIFKK